MDRPKPLLLFDDESLIVHTVHTLHRLFLDVAVVAAPGQELPSLPVTLVRSEAAYQGPVGGMLSGLREAQSETCFVTSCDALFLRRSLISYPLFSI